MGVLLSGSRWTRENHGDVFIHKLGDVPDLAAVLDALGSGREITGLVSDAAGSALANHACVIEAGDTVIAWVDRIRSTPLFFTSEGNVSDEPAQLLPWDPSRVDELAALEMAMAGYALGERTLDSSIRQLRAGEGLIATSGAIRSFRYYAYQPQGGRAATSQLIGSVIDEIFGDTVERAGGANVLVPLSGGWDSRLILAKLIEHGCRHVSTFTYGSPSGHEIAVAQQVADRLGVSWTFIESSGTKLHREDEDRRRSHYWSYAARLSSVPSMAEYVALTSLADEGLLTPEDIVINGQTGDFITGGHIPPDLAATDATQGLMLKKVTDKHLSLWAHLLTQANLEGVTDDVRDEIISGYGQISEETLPWAFESWEYHERQAKFVVNGQRLYEFLGARWELPLWDPRFVDLWAGIDLADKLGQGAFLRYLREYDFKGIFTSIPRALWRWPRRYAWVVPVARALGLVRGTTAKDNFYERMNYHGRYKDQWEAYGSQTYRRYAGDMRNPVSLNAMKLLGELEIPWPGTPLNER